jgi:predicted enzyme related to lactoylglutathione lyase
MAHGDITHIDIPVSDKAKATAFYSNLFGWQIA